MKKNLNLQNSCVEFKFMANNREVVSNSSLRADIEKFGIECDIAVMREEEYDGMYGDTVFKFGEGQPKETYVVLDGQHRLTALNDIISKITKIKEFNEKETDEEKKKPVPSLASFKIPIRIVSKERINEVGGVDNYVIMLNSTSKKWSNKDYISNAYSRNKGSQLLKLINKWSSQKMSMSTISRWLSGNTKTINNKSLQKLAHNEDINDLEWQKGAKLYLALKKLGFDESFLSKRYIVDTFGKIKDGNSEMNAIFRFSKIKSIKKIEALDYKDGDVIEHLKDTVNSDYDDWCSTNSLSMDKIKQLENECDFISSIKEDDITEYLREDLEKKDTEEASINEVV